MSKLSLIILAGILPIGKAILVSRLSTCSRTSTIEAPLNLKTSNPGFTLSSTYQHYTKLVQANQICEKIDRFAFAISKVCCLDSHMLQAFH